MISINIFKDSTPIKVFSFSSSSENKAHSLDQNIESAYNTNNSQVKISKNNETIATEPQNRNASPVQKIRGLTPKIYGQMFMLFFYTYISKFVAKG